MFLPILLILLGITIGYYLPSTKRLKQLSSAALTTLIFLLIFVMGMKIGTDKKIMTQLPHFGYLSLALAVGWIAGCALIGWVAMRLKQKKEGTHEV